jgi:nitrogenase molybdenum-iron protein alpha/beta subunit
MTGAAACLAGFEGMGVIIHGSSGCFFYPATVLHTTLHSTFITEDDVIFGPEKRIFETIDELSPRYQRLAVLLTCVPAVTGDDLKRMIDRDDVIIVDSPGFAGSFEEGYTKAVSQLPCTLSGDAPGVNIDGLSLADPFCYGNAIEIERMLRKAGTSVATRFCLDRFDALDHCAEKTVGANPDLQSGTGNYLGSMLGLDSIQQTVEELGRDLSPDVDALCQEADLAEERLVAACDKYMRRYEPPTVAVFGSFSYAVFAAGMIDRYLDGSICTIASRNAVGTSPYRVVRTDDLNVISAMISSDDPDLIIGSSFERSIAPDCAFVGITPPLRGQVQLRARPLAGTEGALGFMEQVLNACIDHQKRNPGTIHV